MWTIRRLLNWRLRRIRKLGGGRKSPLDISNDVVDMLKADGKAHIAVGYAGGVLLFCRQLRVPGGSGMNRETASVADIGDVNSSASMKRRPASQQDRQAHLSNNAQRVPDECRSDSRDG